MERGISCSARWHHDSLWTKCFRWEHWHVHHWVSKYFCPAQQCQRDSRECPLRHLWSPAPPSPSYHHFLSKLAFHWFVMTLFLSLSSLQEVNSMINKRLKDALFSDQWNELCMDMLSPFGYVLVSTSIILHIFTCRYKILFPGVSFFHPSRLLRWHLNECKGCCWWFFQNSAIFHSSEVCRHRVLAQDSEDIG